MYATICSMFLVFWGRAAQNRATERKDNAQDRATRQQGTATTPTTHTTHHTTAFLRTVLRQPQALLHLLPAVRK